MSARGVNARSAPSPTAGTSAATSLVRTKGRRRDPQHQRFNGFKRSIRKSPGIELVSLECALPQFSGVIWPELLRVLKFLDFVECTLVLPLATRIFPGHPAGQVLPDLWAEC